MTDQKKEKMTTLCDKYKANCFLDIKGQNLAVLKLKSFIKNFPIGKKAVILHGPPGAGKTSLAHVLAKETDSEILELNASDLRNREQIAKVIGSASEQRSLFKKNKILLLDEIDGVNKEDRGGVQELLLLVERTSFPVIMTANNIWDKKFSLLRQKSEMLFIKALDYTEIIHILEDIVQKEKLSLSEDLLMKIAIKSKGDVRAALNDLQSIQSDSRQIDERDKEEDIFVIMKQILQAAPNKETISIYDHTEIPIDELFLWIEENVPLEYHGEELYRAFEALSKADVFKGRIYRQQHWRFLIYENFLLSYGISAAKKRQKSSFVKYKKPTRVLKIWLSNQKKEKMKKIAIKYAHYCHISIRRAMKEFKLLSTFIKDEEIMKQLKLDDEETEFLKNY